MILIAPKVVIARATWRASAGIPGFAIPVLQAVLEVNTEIHLSAPEPRTHGTSCRHTKHHPKQSTKVMAGVRVMLPYMERSVLRSAPAVWLSRSFSLLRTETASLHPQVRVPRTARTRTFFSKWEISLSRIVSSAYWVLAAFVRWPHIPATRAMAPLYSRCLPYPASQASEAPPPSPHNVVQCLHV